MPTVKHQKPIRAGIFADVERAETAVRKLLEAGFRQEQITVVCSDESKERHFRRFHHHTAVDEVAKPGELKSGVIGGLVGGLVSLVGVATTGGLGIVAVGPILAGGVTGTLVGLLIGRGVEDELARFYDQAVTRGNLLVAVEVDDPDAHPQRLAKAARVLKESGTEPFALEEG